MGVFGEGAGNVVFFLTGLHVVLAIWMLYDAYRRGVEPYWFWIIVLVPIIGPLAYALIVALPSKRLFRRGLDKPLWQRKLSLDELRYRVERMPTVINRVALAERLMDIGAHAEAIPHLEAALTLDETYCQALYDLAVCHLACRQAAQALAVLDRLMKRDDRWADYRAWHTLIEAQDALGQTEAALQTCRNLERRVPTWENKCRLAERLIDDGRHGEATQLLEQALEDHRFAPLKIRLRHWRWARRAQRLLREINGK
ncbi:MAG: tetratricopeptide repeat protein [Gemmataceae bacterium]|nr:tetratricopeptide repeat protein [Gemmataceae bacterium]